MATSIPVNPHYSNKDLIENIENGLKKIGKTIETLVADDLINVDEFHLRGHVATHELIEMLLPQADDRLIDLGSGLGGPARRFASATGCHVTGVDLSPDYCATAREISKWLNSEEQTEFHLGDVTNLVGHHDASYDGAYSIHTAMNIEDRNTFYSEVVRVLKRGARFVMYDLIKGDENAEVKYPMPWARTAEDSHIVTRERMLEDLTSAGFAIETVRDDTEDGQKFLTDFITKTSKNGIPPLSLATVLGPIMRDIIPNFLPNFSSGSLRLVAVCAIKQ